MKSSARKVLKYILIFSIAFIVLIQAVPYGRDHHNPPVLREPRWNAPQVRDLTERACFGCHSNETVWPWYSWVAPVSWLIARDVQEGRRELNFSDWRGGTREGEQPDELRKEIEEGEMPPASYLLVHPEARLTQDEKRLLIEGLLATARQTAP